VGEGDCILGRSSCEEKAPCALHARWAALRSEMIGFLKGTRLDSLALEHSLEDGGARKSKETA